MGKQLNHKPDHFQEQAINSTARGIRIVAPAGSGKSETLARRVAKRIEKDGVDPKRILVLTFDNAAKKSLISFFSDLLDRRQIPQIRTFNGHGNQILKRYFPDEIADLQNQSPAFTALKREYNARWHEFDVLMWDGVPRKLSDVFDALKEQGFFPLRDGERDKQTAWLRDEFFRVPRDGESASFDNYWSMPASLPVDETYLGQISAILDTFVQFEHDLRTSGVMGYIDQKARAVQQLYRSRKAILQLQQEFDEIVVDECQDISRLDAMLAYYTAGPRALVVLAGDDDQNLYEFRNAQSLYLRHPEIVFSGIEFETISLNLNYRSPQEILAPAIQLISHNVERLEKSASSGVKHVGSIAAVAYRSPTLLDEGLIQTIRDEIAAGRDPVDIAILCHARDENTLKKPIEKLLMAANIPIVEASSDEQVTQAGVWVRSFLKSKGRQWPVVIIPAVNDRDLPDAESVRKGEVEAIRRRFYVAMTRASEKLVFTYLRGGEDDRIDLTAEGEVIGTNGASRFLFEAGLVQPNAQDQSANSAPETVTADANPASPVSPATELESPPASGVSRDADTLSLPAPTISTAPANRRGRLQPWEPRATETQKLSKALAEWQATPQDMDTAVFCAWKPIEAVLARMVTYPGARRPDMVRVIDDALERRVIDIEWKDKLHLWRQVRNHASHEGNDKGLSQQKFRDHAFSIVHEAPLFFMFLEKRHAPKQIKLESRDEFVGRLSNLVTGIQQDKPSPVSGKPLRALRFNPERDQFEVLAMQLLMVLRDVRFYIPDQFRWSSSPLISKFAVDAIGYMPQGFRTSPSNLLRLDQGEQRNQVLSQFEQIVQQEAGDANAGRFLLHRLEDGLSLQNGNFHAGLKLNPKTGS